MTRIRVPVSGQLLEARDGWVMASGLRIVSVDGPWDGHPGVSLCTFDDDDAPEDLAGKIVELTLTRFGVTTEITGRTVIEEA
jgi:hypothetical protein